jgi:inner membrane protein
MASLGHNAVGMVSSRVHRDAGLERIGWLQSVVLWSSLSFFPDIDVLGFRFGVQYADVWGHRGATHSLLFCAVLGVAIGVGARLMRLPGIRTGAVATLVLVSHPLLDTFTDGGLGCALLWPFDHGRYFAPWNPIPVAPIGLSFLSGRGLEVALTELLLFLPAFIYALRPRRNSPTVS